ncbi:MAG TPA: murein biosynthesis integral membrane protein MurJ [Chloroflexia bacterium]|nr:murein biosynthesis integral membrane protein MurJ [Chloroflexia bacterium]
MAASRIAKAAFIIMVGSVLSRVLGLGREVVISYQFGAGAKVDAFTAAAHISTIIYDLLISGMVSAALVPVLSEYAAPERRAELGRIVGIILTGAVCVLVVGVGVLEIFAGPIVHFITNCADPCPATERLALDMTRIVLPGVVFMGISAVLMSTLYALHRFAFPSLAMSALNAAIIGAALLLTGILDVQSLAVGMAAGAVLMVAIQWPGVHDVPIRLGFDLHHPAVRRILRLYAPIAVSLVVSQLALVFDRRFAFEVGEGSVSAMRYGTTLIQFALGIVGAAISLAALPSLSQHFANGDEPAYRRTLGAGMRLVTVLVLPAAAGLFFLAVPLVTLFFEGGAFTEGDTWSTVLALLCYVLGLPAAALNQVLIFGFYSRKNTVTPVTVGICGVAVYLVAALLLKGPLGMAGLVLASSAQLTFNATVTGLLLWRMLGGLPGQAVGRTALKCALGALLMGVTSFAAWGALAPILPGDNKITQLLLLGVPGATGLLAYAATLYALRVPELTQVTGMVLRRLPGRRPAPPLPPLQDGAREDVVFEDAAQALGSEGLGGGLDPRLVSVDLGDPDS